LWLSKRIEISKLIESFDENELESLLNIPKQEIKNLKKQSHPFKLLSGDLMQHYPYGRVFDFSYSDDEYQRFLDKDITPTGLLCGKRAKLSSGYSREIEKSFDEEINADGQRRYAWVFPDEISGNYKSQEAWYEFNFFLPKGSYATVLLEEIAKKEIKE
jgi:tRNA pseudouridine13 synthase